MADLGEDTRTDEEFMADLAERQRAYLVWRDGLLAGVRGAVGAERGCGGSAGFHSKLLDKVETVLTAEHDARDAAGVLVALPGTRRLCLWLLSELAEEYGVEVPERP